MFTPRNILVTGGAGFIGSNFVHWFLTEYPKTRIINLDLLTYAGSRDNLVGLSAPDRHELVVGDIRDRSLIDRLLRERDIDTVIHFAAESHVDRSIAGPEIFITTNVHGTFTLLESARQYWQEEKRLDNTQCRFHHISTDEVYGSLRPEDPAFTETTPYAPNSPYSASKAGSDHLVRSYFHTYGLPCVTTNCSNNYGPRQHGEKLIPTIIRSCRNRIPIPVYGQGVNVRDWLYVDDHCRGIDRVLRQGEVGETYNIGGVNEWRNIDIVRLICTMMDQCRPLPDGSRHEELITFVADRKGHDLRYAINADKMRDELGWTPRETFETGIAKTLQWYLQREPA